MEKLDPKCILETHYEEILSNPTGVLGEIAKYLNLNIAEDKMVDIAKSINVNRLDNSELRQEYKSEIEKISNIGILKKLGYEV